MKRITPEDSEKAVDKEWRVDFREAMPSEATRQAIADAQLKSCEIQHLEEMIEWLRTSNAASYYSPEAGCEVWAIPIIEVQFLQDELDVLLKELVK